MLKNSSPRQLAFYAALIITGGFLLIALPLQFIFDTVQVSPIGLGVLILTCFSSAFFVIFYILKRYIYRRIKLIYKSIHHLKLASNKKMSTIDMGEDIISEVEKEVSEWADNTEEEIKSLRSLANYRRNYMGNVSHELKTPLFSIQGYLHTLLEGGLYDENINRNYLSRAAKNVERLQNIVQGLEAISRMESGEAMLHIKAFDIKALAEEVAEDLQSQTQKRGIELIFKEGADRGYEVKADRESIRQVFTNLIINALKYGKEESGVIKIGFYDMDSNILIEVADNGIGIAEEHIAHLFDRFYRVDSSRSRSEGGSGLGLSIVKHIIEAHKQTINARSQLNVGSTFGFTLEKA